MADYLTADEIDESKELVKLLIGMDFKNANLEEHKANANLLALE